MRPAARSVEIATAEHIWSTGIAKRIALIGLLANQSLD
jgi:hypothetical protein